MLTLKDKYEVRCDWCWNKVVAFLAHYTQGLFYHKECWQEKKNDPMA